nr:MAG TPA: hypothetical protein [Caudoviricetes sp.]
MKTALLTASLSRPACLLCSICRWTNKKMPSV